MLEDIPRHGPKLADELREAGADPHAANDDGETALMLAAKQGHADIVEALRRAGARR